MFPIKKSQELEVYPIFRLPLARGTAFRRALLRRQPPAPPAEQLKPGTPWRSDGEWLIGHQNGSWRTLRLVKHGFSVLLSKSSTCLFSDRIRSCLKLWAWNWSGLEMGFQHWDTGPVHIVIIPTWGGWSSFWWQALRKWKKPSPVPNCIYSENQLSGPFEQDQNHVFNKHIDWNMDNQTPPAETN